MDFETVESTKKASQDPAPSIEEISNEMAKSAYLEIKPKFNTYNLATNFFNSQRYFGDVCNRCKKLDYFAFRMGNRYLTANAGDLQWNPATSPANTQLFTAEQQIDGTWAFKSLTQGKYIRADSNGNTINWQTFVGPWERWYIERHGSHVHIQSAQFQFFYWVNSGPVLRQFRGGASAMIVEHWPAIKWLWNW